MKRKKLGLALGAGGANGIAHVGFLEVLAERGLKPDVIAGSSIGSVIGSLYANGYPISSMIEQVDKLKHNDIVDFDPFFFNSLGLVRGKKAEALLKSLIGEDTTFDDLSLPFGCVAVDLLSGNKVYLTEGLVWRASLASSAIPTAFRPVEIDGMLLVDGGILDRVPGELCRNLGADVVIGVDVLGKTPRGERPANIISTIIRSYYIMEYEMTVLRTSNVDYMVEIEQANMNSLKVRNLHESYENGRAAALGHVDKITELME